MLKEAYFLTVSDPSSPEPRPFYEVHHVLVAEGLVDVLNESSKEKSERHVFTLASSDELGLSKTILFRGAIRSLQEFIERGEVDDQATARWGYRQSGDPATDKLVMLLLRAHELEAMLREELADDLDPNPLPPPPPPAGPAGSRFLVVRFPVSLLREQCEEWSHKPRPTHEKQAWVFYETDSQIVAEKLLDQFRHEKPQGDVSPILEVVKGAALNLPERVRYGQEIGVLEEIESVGDWDPGIWAEGGLPHDRRTVLLMRHRHRAQQWEPLIRDELGIGDAKGETGETPLPPLGRQSGSRASAESGQRAQGEETLPGGPNALAADAVLTRPADHGSAPKTDRSTMPPYFLVVSIRIAVGPVPEEGLKEPIACPVVTPMVFYETDLEVVAKELVRLFETSGPALLQTHADCLGISAAPLYEVRNGADLDLAQRVLYRDAIRRLQDDISRDQWGIQQGPGQRLDRLRVFLMRCHEQARKWEPLVRDELDRAGRKGRGIYLWWTWGTVYPREPTADLDERFYFYRVASEDVAACLCRAFNLDHGDEIRFGYTPGDALNIDQSARANDSIEEYRKGEITGEDAQLFAAAREWEIHPPAERRRESCEGGPADAMPSGSKPPAEGRAPTGAKEHDRPDSNAKPAEEGGHDAVNAESKDRGESQAPDFVHRLSTAIAVAVAVNELDMISHFYPTSVNKEEMASLRRTLEDWLMAKLDEPGFEKVKKAVLDPKVMEARKTSGFAFLPVVLGLFHPAVETAATEAEIEQVFGAAVSEGQKRALPPISGAFVRISEIQMLDCRIPHPEGDSTYQDKRRFVTLLQYYWSLCRGLVVDQTDAPIGFQPHPLLPLIVNARSRIDACFKKLASLGKAQEVWDTVSRLLDALLSGDPDELSVMPEYARGQVAKVDAFLAESRLLLGSAAFEPTHAELAFATVFEREAANHRQRVKTEWDRLWKRLEAKKQARERNGTALSSATQPPSSGAHSAPAVGASPPEVSLGDGFPALGQPEGVPTARNVQTDEAETPNIEGDKLPPSRVKARALYDWALTVIEGADSMTVADLLAAIKTRLDAEIIRAFGNQAERLQELKSSLPTNPDTFGRYLREAGIKKYSTKGDKMPGRSVRRRSDI